jgi:DNA mismatch endonuclease Vsr
MSRIRGKHTTPEKVVRSLLRRLGYPFRLHVRIPITTPVAPKSDEGGKDTEYTKPFGHKRTQRTQRPFPLRLERGEGQGEVSKQTVSRVTRHLSPRFVCPDIVLSKHKTAIFVHGCFWHRHRGCKNCTTPTHRREWWLKKLEGNAARDKLHQRALRKLGWRPIVIWECQTEKPKTLDRLSRKLVKLIG